MKRDTLGTLRARLEIVKRGHAELWDEKEQLRRRAEVAEAALRPFAKYINARLAIFSVNSRNAYPHLLLSHGSGKPTSDLHPEDWEKARVVVEGIQESKP